LRQLEILIIGGGIGGLTSAIGLRKHGHSVTVIEKDPSWSVYGVGIIQQANAVRAMADLGLLDDYLSAGVGFDAVEVFAPDGTKVARVPSPRLKEGFPANVGIGRRALHKVLGDNAIAAGATIRLGVTASRLHEDGAGVTVSFSVGGEARYDLVIGSDGVYSQTRAQILPEAETPQFTGQSVWRYNLPRPAGLDALQAYNGPTGVGLVPLSESLMYLFATTAEPDNPIYPVAGLADAMRTKLAHAAPAIRALSEGITDDESVVYRPLEVMLVTGPWHKGRVVLLGDAVHATTPHLGQGGGMAIEDSIVLADELSKADNLEAACSAYRARRFDRCAYIVRASLAICHGQIGRGPSVDLAHATAEMFAITAQPI
jgi:2-polyprenyl-6-methoxyphenol hydroxylase-like FAD-dependent oxidoreductase